MKLIVACKKLIQNVKKRKIIFHKISTPGNLVKLRYFMQHLQHRTIMIL